MVGEHNEVVAATGADGETAHVVSVELAYGLYLDMEFLGFGCRLRWFCWCGRRCDPGGADSLSRLLGVALDIFDGDRAILGCIGGGEACTGRIVT